MGQESVHSTASQETLQDAVREASSVEHKEGVDTVLQTACGGNIVVPYETKLHLKAHPEVFDILDEAVSRITLPKDSSFLRLEVDLGRELGFAGCVTAPKVGLTDTATFAKRLERERASRVTLETQGEKTSIISVLAYPKEDDPQTYRLITAWVGSLAPKEPWDPNITSESEEEESLEFWSDHALVYDSSVMEEPFESTWQNIIL